MDKTPDGLVVEVEEKVRQRRSEENSINNWESRFRERLESTLEQLVEAYPEPDRIKTDVTH